MYLLKNNQNVKTFAIALGPQPTGQKEYEGDGKTPEGIYKLDWQRWDTPVFHSFHISYPNKADSIIAMKKGLVPGSNIMVHGTSKAIKKKKDWTNGCIALTNEDMVVFRKMVFQDTPIEIRK
jgi:murein L,D-transpeptidase YafK